MCYFNYRKIEILFKRTTRERLLLFFDLHRQSARQFTVPFFGKELEVNLCVERSAMSIELSQMQREGLIQFDRNSFEIMGGTILISIIRYVITKKSPNSNINIDIREI